MEHTAQNESIYAYVAYLGNWWACGACALHFPKVFPVLDFGLEPRLYAMAKVTQSTPASEESLGSFVHGPLQHAARWYTLKNTLKNMLKNTLKNTLKHTSE